MLPSTTRNPPPNSLSCVSCGLELAQAQLLMDESNDRDAPLIILLSDGLQNVGGTPSKTESVSNAIKAQDTQIVTVGFNRTALLRLASEPTNVSRGLRVRPRSR